MCSAIGNWGLAFLFVTVAGEDRETGIPGEAGIGLRKVAENELGASCRFDAAGMQAIGTQTSTKRVIRLLLCLRHGNKDSAVWTQRLLE